MVISLPGSEKAVRLAMDKLVIPELAHLVQQANEQRHSQFLATSGVVIAGIWVPDWTEGFQSTSTDAARTEAAEAALAHAASLGRVCRHSHQPVSS